MVLGGGGGLMSGPRGEGGGLMSVLRGEGGGLRMTLDFVGMTQESVRRTQNSVYMAHG